MRTASSCFAETCPSGFVCRCLAPGRAAPTECDDDSTSKSRQADRQAGAPGKCLPRQESSMATFSLRCTCCPLASWHDQDTSSVLSSGVVSRLKQRVSANSYPPKVTYLEELEGRSFPPVSQWRRWAGTEGGGEGLRICNYGVLCWTLKLTHYSRLACWRRRRDGIPPSVLALANSWPRQLSEDLRSR